MRRFIAALLVAVTGWLSAWTGPFQLTTDTGDDINPSVCREWLEDTLTCVVWQSNRNGNWDIYARFCAAGPGNGWLPEHRVSTDSLEEVHPAVACRSDYSSEDWFWCCWERRETEWFGGIWASFSRGDTWDPPVRIGRSLHGAAGDSSQPSLVIIRDTTWVVWANRDTFGSYISFSCHDGNSWSQERDVVYTPHEMRHARIGRGASERGQQYPFVTWQQQGDVWFTEHRGGQWTSPARIDSTPADDRNPEVLNQCGWQSGWSGVVWESERDGDTAVFAAHADSLDVCQRLCDSTGAGSNRRPQAAFATFSILDWSDVLSVWISDRNGNPDVFSRTGSAPADEAVDTDPAQDLCPMVTVVWLTQAWCCWQSDRTGNWDLYGSYQDRTGIEQPRFPVSDGRTKIRVLSGSLDHGPEQGWLVDVTGRKVMALAPGRNDVSHLPAGIYSVRRAADNSTTRVVIQH